MKKNQTLLKVSTTKYCYLAHQTYFYRWQSEDSPIVYEAKILFCYDEEKDKWEFDSCMFQPLQGIYSITDWQFLRDLSFEVLRLNEQINKKT
jgi:hypothetical protein